MNAVLAALDLLPAASVATSVSTYLPGLSVRLPALARTLKLFLPLLPANLVTRTALLDLALARVTRATTWAASPSRNETRIHGLLDPSASLVVPSANAENAGLLRSATV